jgi:hypothetical protein
MRSSSIWRTQLIFWTPDIDGAFGATAGGGALPHAAHTAAIVIGPKRRVIRIACAQSTVSSVIRDA